MARQRYSITAMLTCTLLLTAAGCDSGSGPPAVDLAKLDSGNYLTTPRTIAPTAQTGAIQESVELAKHLPLILDIDSRMVFGNATSGNFAFTADHPPPVEPIYHIDDFNAAAPGLIAGFRTGGQRRISYALGLEAQLGVLRFGTPDQAGHALSLLAGAQAAQPNTTDTSIPAYPDARAEINEYGSVMTWLVRDTYLVWTIVEDNLAPAPDPVPLSRFTARIYDKLFEMLRDYHPTAPDRLATLPADVDGLLGRTLPSPKVSDWTPAILTPRAALHLDYYPAQTSRIFADAKVDLVAIDRSTITRAGDRPAAARLLAAYVDQLAGDYGPFDGPPGLPGAKCLKKLDDPVGPAVVTYTCFIGYDRYVAQVWAEQPQDLYQEAAAQYKLLAAGH